MVNQRGITMGTFKLTSVLGPYVLIILLFALNWPWFQSLGVYFLTLRCSDARSLPLLQDGGLPFLHDNVGGRGQAAAAYSSFCTAPPWPHEPRPYFPNPCALLCGDRVEAEGRIKRRCGCASWAGRRPEISRRWPKTLCRSFGRRCEGDAEREKPAGAGGDASGVRLGPATLIGIHSQPATPLAATQAHKPMHAPVKRWGANDCNSRNLFR
jgi:hypothetical protein